MRHMSEPAAGWLSEEQQRVWRSYLLANAHINEYLETALRAFDLSLAEYELLVRLSESPCHTIRMGELAASVGHSRLGQMSGESSPSKTMHGMRRRCGNES